MIRTVQNLMLADTSHFCNVTQQIIITIVIVIIIIIILVV